MRTANECASQENCVTCSWRQSQWFCGLSGEGLLAFQRIALPRTQPAGAVLYAEGQAADGIFVLCNGRAKISISSRRGSVVILKIAEAGEALGLEAVLARRPHEETAELLDSCQIKFIPKHDLCAFLAEHPEAALRAAHQLNVNCRSAREQIRHIGFSVSGSEKLTRLLVTWASAGKINRHQERIVQMPFTHQEIAQMIGSTRETITRVLNHWKRERIIEVSGKTLIVKNLEELEKLANG
jgi:CRP/FNR family cyclic AMP-dependent transcriptional regulator